MRKEMEEQKEGWQRAGEELEEEGRCKPPSEGVHYLPSLHQPHTPN
jgi:hypothetical protein